MMEWVGGLGEAWGAPALTADAQQRAEVVVPALARRDWKQLRKGVAALPDQPPDSELHRIRILAKRVRYAAEAAEPIARKIATRTAEDAAALQDVLGDHQDSVTVQQWLREAGRGPRAFVAGGLAAPPPRTNAPHPAPSPQPSQKTNTPPPTTQLISQTHP